MEYRKIDFKFIMDYCEQHNEKDWLKAKVEETTEVKVYPKVKNANGKMVSDKSKKPKIEVRPISFLQVKNDFCAKFMPELLPKKGNKKKSMREMLKNW